jgi:hypothetical protein
MRGKFLLLTSTLLLVASCNKKPEVKPITEWEEYSDQFFKVTFKYPKGWHVLTEVNKVTIYNDSAAVAKFFDPFSKNPIGAQFVVAAERIDTLQDLAKYVESFRVDLNSSGYDVKPAETRTIEGIAGQMTLYSGRFDKETALRAMRTSVLKDSSYYYVHFGGFNEFFEPYKSVYDTLLATLTLPKPKIPMKDVDISLPSADLSKFGDDMLEFTYPDNFSTTLDKPKGEVEYGITLKGYRQDAFIEIDVRPAKKLSLDKVVEQNSKNFKGATGKQSTKISGESAAMLLYKPMNGVEGRVYFVVKNDKFYRIIVLLPVEKKKEFAPAFEKTVASIRLKR